MPEEEKKEEEKVVVLTTDMHCHACQEKINKVLKNFPGVETIDLDARERKVTVKGKMDARSVFEAVKRKCGKRTLLVYPQLSPEDEQKKEEEKEKLPKDEPPPDITVELKIRMHCGACAKDIRKMLLKVDGVTEVLEDLGSEKVVVKGKGLDSEKLCQKVRKSGKHCQVIAPPPPPPKDEKKEEGAKGEGKEAEDKKDEEKEEKKEESAGEVKVEVKKYVNPPYQTVQYIYAPQLFSDENPNACYIM